eukprot:TRINITY_DN14450_c0_g1_i1.p1 TRINITY_DN14450_c0_g1~~TRINITY_DN14450_c0_g1_i1.p1  ORF type:complete len:192 (-),score=71.50 TRINITY_DN14450_c0_g1_i1:210-785(-)
MKRRRGEEVSEAGDSSDEDLSSEGEYANKMSSFIQSRNVLDKAKQSDIRRQRRLKKEGRLPNDKHDQKPESSRRAGGDEDSSDEGEYYQDADASSDDDDTEYMGNVPKSLGGKRGRNQDDDSDSEDGGDGGLAALLKAARGELYEKDPTRKYKDSEVLDEEAAAEAVHYEDVRPARKTIHIASTGSKKTRK